MTEIIDPVAGVACMLDDENKSIHRITMRSPAPRTGARESVVGSDPQRVVEPLGTKNIEGFLAQGMRLTTTWPADSQANGRHTVQTGESWYSPDLKMMLILKRDDPRNGVHTMKLINISRAEPDPSLFQPPSDYTIVDEKDSFQITLKRP